MESHVTPEMAADELDRLQIAGTSVGLSPAFCNPVIADSEEEGLPSFAEYLERHGVEFFSEREIVTPHKPRKATEAGFDDLTPPPHLWPWALLVVKVGDMVRREVGNPVRLRNLYRPMSYNRLVAKSGIDSDHPNACAGDFDFSSVSHRRTAEQMIRNLAAENPELEVSLGMGARSLHVGILSPKGSRSWFYDSYGDPRRPLN